MGDEYLRVHWAPMNLAYFEDSAVRQLYPLTWLRAAFELRCGRSCLIDKVQAILGCRPAGLFLRDVLTDTVLARTTLAVPDLNENWCLLNARALLTGPLEPPRPGVVWRQDGDLVAAGLRPAEMEALNPGLFFDPARLDEWMAARRAEEPPPTVRLIRYPWDLVLANADELRRELRESGVARGARVHRGVHLLARGQIYIGRKACLKPGVVLDAEEGPIHVDEGVLIQPNAVVEGPCYIGSGSVVRPGAVLRGGTSIGPVCKVGGEVAESIFQGYSSKQHDGFVGHSFVGSWVNLGADTVTSDLKNTYGTVRVSINGVGVETGLQFLGATIGDHAKTGIGTVLPTGGVIGVAANVFTRRIVPKFVPSFAWVTDEGMIPYRVDKAILIARIVMGRRNVELTAAECALLERTAALAREVEAAGWPA